MKNNNIDNLFKDGLNQKSFDYDDNNWEAFKKLYDQEEDDKPGVFPIPKLGLALLIILFVTGLTFLNIDGSQTNNTDQHSSLQTNTKENPTKKHSTINNKISESKNLKADNIRNKEVAQKATVVSQITKSELPSVSPQVNLPITTTTFANKYFKNEVKTTSPIDLEDLKSEVQNQKIRNESSASRLIVAAPDRRSTSVKLQSLESNTLQLLSIPKNKIATLHNYISIDQRDSPTLFLLGAGGIGSLNNKFLEVGLGISIPIREKINITVAPSYHFIQASELPKHRGFDTKYSLVDGTFFGQHIEADQLHFFKLPISIGLQIDNRHQISLGLAYQYLMATQGTITKTIEGAKHSHKAWIIETGLNRNFFSTQLEYGFKISDSKEIFLEGELFLTDLYNQSVDLPVTHRFQSIKIGMKHFFRMN